MGVFEQYPILLILLIVGVIEGWSALKTIIRRLNVHRAIAERGDHAGKSGD